MDKPEPRSPEWERLQRDHHGDTHRMQVPGGWLYRTTVWGGGEDSPPAVAMAFVPDHL